MCGIVGALAQRNVVPILVEGLRRLEYRGYDSAGISVLNENSALMRVREMGKLKNLEQTLKTHVLAGQVGIAHTRWATHGVPSKANAHPHSCKEHVSIVHNGIIENHVLLKEQQLQKNHIFSSETDSEVIVHQVYDYLQEEHDLLTAVRKTVSKLEGAYSLGVICQDEPQRLIAVRYGSPLVVGLGIEEYFIASDVLALLPVTQRFMFLEDGDIADITPSGVTIYDQSGQVVQRPIHESELAGDTVSRGSYRHFMLKEIHEQPAVIAASLEGRILGQKVIESCFGPLASHVFDQIDSIQIVACGTSYHSGLVAKYWFEEIGGIPCQVEVASEFRYRKPVVKGTPLFVTISQSGETADTLAALRAAKQLGFQYTMAICNVPESSLVRESDLSLLTRAGPEIGVASTKAFTTQLVALLLMVLVVGRRHALSAKLEQQIVTELLGVASKIEDILKQEKDISILAEEFVDKHHALFLGRGTKYPIALEGALKLKEISYIHAEAYPAGELKHGPLALVDEDMPIIAVAPNDALIEKLKSNLEEVRARGGKLYIFADEDLHLDNSEGCFVMHMPSVHRLVSAIAYTVPLQLLAYYVAVLRGTDVDQPRNLAKSVTVE